jgi:hypothetical protein
MKLPDPLTPKTFYFEYLGWCACGNPEEALIFMQEVLALLNARHIDGGWKAIHKALLEKLGSELQPGLYWSYLYMLDAAGLIEHGFNISGSWLTEQGQTVLAMLEAHDDFEAALDEPSDQEGIRRTLTIKTFLGFPFVADETMPPLRLEMLLEEDPKNETGQIELHGRSFMAMPGDVVELFFRDQLVTTIEFTNGTLLDGPLADPQIGPELQRFVDSLTRVQ